MTVAILFVMSVFAAQLVRLQGFDAAATSATALSNRTVTEQIPALRGTIYDVDGTVLATSLDRRTVTVDQTAVPTYRKTVGDTSTTVGVRGAAEDLAPLLEMSEYELRQDMTGDARYRILAKDVSPLTWRRISDLGIPGIYSERTSERTYPQSTNEASLVGYVTADGKPGGGVELMLDDELRGRSGRAVYEIGQDGSRLPQGRHEVDTAREGDDVRLTIDNDLQWYAQNALAEKVQQTRALSGTVVAMNAKTGRLLALASYPTFDPNDIAHATGSLSNLALTDVFEPGSTAKIMTAAAALEEGAVTPSTPMVIPGLIHRSDTWFRDSHPHPTEYRTFAGALAESSNIGFILAGEQLEPQTMESYLRKFGLGAPSGLGFPGESPGLLAPSDSWSGSQRYTVLFGQGLSVTAIQAAGVFQAIANGGERIAPSIVDGVMGEDGEWHAPAAPARTRVVSEGTAHELSTMLEGVVSEDGTAPEAQIPGYRVAGKTGTADRYDSTIGGYSGKTASFIGYAPADDPQIVVAVILQRPIKGYYGGTVAAPVFKDVMTYALQREQVPPTPGDTKRPKLRLELSKPPSPNNPDVLRDSPP